MSRGFDSRTWLQDCPRPHAPESGSRSLLASITSPKAPTATKVCFLLVLLLTLLMFATVQKTKSELIHKAKVRRSYAKLKAQEEIQAPARTDLAGRDDASAQHPTSEPASLTPHPARLALMQSDTTPTLSTQGSRRRDGSETATRAEPTLGGSDSPPAQDGQSASSRLRSTSPQPQKAYQPSARARSSKVPPFAREERIAAERRAKEEQRVNDRAEADAQREVKLAERARWQKSWRKARRPDRDGRRRLGRQSKLLLQKVLRLVGASEKNKP